MLGALLLNIPRPGSGDEGYEDHYKRRPNEKVVWRDDWLKAQEELTKFKALPEDEQIEVTAQAIETLKGADSDIEAVIDAREVVQNLPDANGLLAEIEELHILIIGYYMLELNRKRNNIAAMLMLGVL